MAENLSASGQRRTVGRGPRLASVVSTPARSSSPPRSAMPVGRVVIVDPAWDRYPEFVEAAAAGRLELHFCSDGRAALRLARRFQADAWLVSDNLPDMDGLDLVPLLAEQVCQNQLDPLVRPPRRSTTSQPLIGRGRVFFVAPHHSPELEARSLASGTAGYLVQPIAIDLLASIVPLESPAAGLTAGRRTTAMSGSVHREPVGRVRDTAAPGQQP